MGTQFPLPWREGMKGRGNHPHPGPPPSRERELKAMNEGDGISRKGRNDMKFRGRIWKFGDNIDTDAIIPARQWLMRRGLTIGLSTSKRPRIFGNDTRRKQAIP
jgi:hypothetical protein